MTYILWKERDLNPRRLGSSGRRSTNWATFPFGWMTGYDPATSGTTNQRSTDWATSTIIPHFTRLMDWLPYGSGGLLLSGLRGDGGYRTHSSGFSVQRNHLICHISNLGVIRDSNPYLNFHRVKCSSFDSPLTIMTPYKQKSPNSFEVRTFEYCSLYKYRLVTSYLRAIHFQYRTGC